MTYWLIAFAAALLVVIDFATGLPGVIVALLAFAVALFLFWANTLGFMGAWTKFGLDRVAAPFMDDDTRARVAAMFSDQAKVAKACTVALVLIALSLMVPPYQLGIAVAVIAAWYVWQIRRAHRPVKTTTVSMERPSPMAEPVIVEEKAVKAEPRTTIN
ncbi:hypothetical protein A33M_3088 [Rhodovulum sp. PH10]|uniref:hypothetical protein n=1 Tax=Rhodovulum sp. PH10 TaxID=1187851 RepID=UPI00027C1E57|nr:hypothetical protein [Rhodovulum sp. PH10]EJW11475.1 hypothetical protein A33M_3088 [Rhodovulum sp. PH10]